MVKIILKPSSPTLRPDHPKEYQVLARTNNLFYAQYVKEHVCGNDTFQNHDRLKIYGISIDEVNLLFTFL